MTSDPGEVARLIAGGGWALDDVQARHAAHPDTFLLPSADDLAGLSPGTCARLIFAVADQADPVRDGLDPYDGAGAPNLVVSFERMWVWVREVDADGLTGVLQNLPMATHTRLVPGASVRFRPEDVIEVDLDPPAPMIEEIARMAGIGFPVLAFDVVTEPEDPYRRPSIALRKRRPAIARASGRSGPGPSPGVWSPDPSPRRSGRSSVSGPARSRTKMTAVGRSGPPTARWKKRQPRTGST